MGGTSLVTKGILGPIEGSVIIRSVTLPLEVDYVVNDLMVELDEDIYAEAVLPDELEAVVEFEGMDVETDFPALDVEAEVTED